MTRSPEIKLKKIYGQNFLNDYAITQKMIGAVTLSPTSSVLEIGPGGGFLTRAILERTIKNLWAFEIDPEWADHLKKTITDARLSIFQEDFLLVDPARFAEHQPWIVLANLPYCITFPILHYLHKQRAMIAQGVIMVQEEVAQKIVKKSGRGFGAMSLFFQRFFDWQLLDKIPPSSFNPAPKVFSRLLYFKPRDVLEPIVQEDEFWAFVKVCFAQPRRTMVNNIKQSPYQWIIIPERFKPLRAQQVAMQDLIDWWHEIIKQRSITKS